MDNQEESKQEALIDAISGISNHKEMLCLCVADYLVARTVCEARDFAKEILFVYMNKEKHKEIWDGYTNIAGIMDILENNSLSEDEKIIVLNKVTLSFDARNVGFIPKYLMDYYNLREKYNICSSAEKINPEMRRNECPIPPMDFIELNKEYAWLTINNNLISSSYFELKIYGKTDDIIDILANEIALAKSFLTDNNPDSQFLKLNITMLEKKIEAIRLNQLKKTA